VIDRLQRKTGSLFDYHEVIKTVSTEKDKTPNCENDYK
jgi:hypothetical protein